MRLSSAIKGVGGWLEEVVRVATAPVVQDRPRDAREFLGYLAEAEKEALPPEPAPARPQRSRSWNDRDSVAEWCPHLCRWFGEPEGTVACPTRNAERAVISLAPGTKVFLACHPVDLRNGFDGLAVKAQQIIGADPFSGHLFIFRGKRGDYFKGLVWPLLLMVR